MAASRRPGPLVARGAVASVVLAGSLVLATSGCGSSAVEVAAPSSDLSADDAATCAALVDALPDTVGGELRRPVEPEDALGAAWGEPAYVLTCGVDRPAEWARDSECSDIGGVGWFVVAAEQADPRVDLTAYALTHTPHVSLEVPSRYRAKGLDLALTDLAPVLDEQLTAGKPCR